MALRRRTNKLQGGKSRLYNAGTSADDGMAMRRWRKLASLNDTDEE